MLTLALTLRCDPALTVDRCVDPSVDPPCCTSQDADPQQTEGQQPEDKPRTTSRSELEGIADLLSQRAVMLYKPRSPAPAPVTKGLAVER